MFETLTVPSPDKVNNAPNEKLIRSIVAKVTENLSDQRWVENNRCGNPDNPGWCVTHAGFANTATKEVLIAIFKRSGWNNVNVRNSHENGEKPGMLGITFSAF